MISEQVLSLVGLLLVAASIGGCTEPNSEQPETFPVVGKITYLSSPLTKATITFQPAAGQLATAQIGPDGSYRLGTFGSGDGAVSGSYRVMVIANEVDHHALPKPGARPAKVLIPARYGKVETSGLQATVEKKQNKFNFDLK
jgi:hypothetical protein